jgi:hypothetical protein
MPPMDSDIGFLENRNDTVGNAEKNKKLLKLV